MPADKKTKLAEETAIDLLLGELRGVIALQSSEFQAQMDRKNNLCTAFVVLMEPIQRAVIRARRKVITEVDDDLQPVYDIVACDKTVKFEMLARKVDETYRDMDEEARDIQNAREGSFWHKARAVLADPEKTGRTLKDCAKWFVDAHTREVRELAHVLDEDEPDAMNYRLGWERQVAAFKTLERVLLEI